MHEISIAGAIVDTVIDTANKNNAQKVDEVFIEIGELTALNTDQLKFIFETITKGTVAEGAKYNIETISPLIECKKCEYKGKIKYFEKLHFFLPAIKCPDCGETDVEVTAGRECCVRKIKIS
ncbi:MAG: hydrogenase maturation nickel metallochaperone HypA [Candidatus Methanoperedens sp.]|jgi:hydrogenase nickel incorporation protein HypA/HybF|nr:hydrogenase maturation nickel metallochaperone HypA [Candidatus Methanoperedens sp.]PKL54082.1 MAG: hydrogenase maturation nickel metallochaperone HypA [Candidatus Methanoperedenaceae archaeon HGW-Methanoperedenaceae-1]